MNEKNQNTKEQILEEYRKVFTTDGSDHKIGFTTVKGRTTADTVVEDWLSVALDQAVEGERKLEKGRAILVMNEFVKEKGEDFSLGRYLNMLIALTPPKETN